MMNALFIQDGKTHAHKRDASKLLHLSSSIAYDGFPPTTFTYYRRLTFSVAGLAT